MMFSPLYGEEKMWWRFTIWKELLSNQRRTKKYETQNHDWRYSKRTKATR